MIKIENIEIVGWEPAIRGARNPMNSWDKSDSYWTHIENPETLNTARFQYFVGENDLKLLRNLANAGPDHGKFLRMIQVYCDITAPLYWYKEMDTYRMGVEKNSCSTMHKIHSKPFEMADFSHKHLNLVGVNMLKVIVDTLEANRRLFLDSKDKKFWWQLIQLLPSSYNQRRTYMISYAALRSMYHARKNHKLDEWREFCQWVESLPYAAELITNQEANHDHDKTGIENHNRTR